jgi:excisionase family DNA binding protein
VTPRPVVVLPEHDLLTVAEVAAAFRASVQTVNRWTHLGKLSSVRTPGGAGPGHHRYRRADIDAILNGPEAVR